MAFKKGFIPWNKGKKLAPLSKELKLKIGLKLKGKPAWNKGNKGLKPWIDISGFNKFARLGTKQSEDTKKKIGDSHRGSKSVNWIVDRSKLKVKQQRNDSAYQEWRKQVWTRDNFKCKIDNQDCKGHIEAHHILDWSNFPELRYQIKNGITLCHAHHPRKRAEEKRLVPTFKELMSVSKA